MSDSASAETAVPSPRLAALVVLRTDVGLVRSENQDFAAFTTPREERGSHPGGRLLIVADGMGGHRGGASRIYRVRGGEIEQLTEDHSLVASMVREGLLTSKEAENHPRRNVLQRSMGVSEEVEIDVRGPFDLQVDDVYILCSDGLHGVVKEEEIKEHASLPLDEAADRYVKLVL